jgi:hypothetical protein
MMTWFSVDSSSSSVEPMTPARKRRSTNYSKDRYEKKEEKEDAEETGVAAKPLQGAPLVWSDRH